DTSGSMDGRPLEQAKGVAKELIATLSPRDSLNIIGFADGLNMFKSAPEAAGAQLKAEATAWIDALHAGGGTELGRGVGERRVRKPGADRVRMVYLLTDGYVGNDDEVLGAVKRTVGMNRIFPIGVGSAVNRYLLDRLGQMGRGFTSYLLPADAP